MILDAFFLCISITSRSSHTEISLLLSTMACCRNLHRWRSADPRSNASVRIKMPSGSKWVIDTLKNNKNHPVWLVNYICCVKFQPRHLNYLYSTTTDFIPVCREKTAPFQLGSPSVRLELAPLSGKVTSQLKWFLPKMKAQPTSKS